MDDDKGTSLVLLHSQKGKLYFQALDKKISYKKVTLEQAVAQNPSILHSSLAKPERDAVLASILIGDFDTAVKPLLTSSKKSNFLTWLKTKMKRIFRR